MSIEIAKVTKNPDPAMSKFRKKVVYQTGKHNNYLYNKVTAFGITNSRIEFQ